MSKFHESELRPISEGEACVCMERIYIPIVRYEQLLRAEIELNVLEASIAGDTPYQTVDIYKTIKKAREKAIAQVATIKVPEESEVRG